MYYCSLSKWAYPISRNPNEPIKRSEFNRVFCKAKYSWISRLIVLKWVRLDLVSFLNFNTVRAEQFHLRLARFKLDPD